MMERNMKNNSTQKNILEGWQVKKLGQLCDLMYGKSRKEAGDNIDGKYPVYGSSGIIGYADKYLHEGPSIIIGRKGTIDNPLYVEKPFWPVDTIYYATNFRDVDPKWLYYRVETIAFKSYNEASGVPSLNRNTLNDIKVDVPPLETQKKTINVLLEVDKRIEKVVEVIRKTEELKKGLMRELLTKGIGHKKFRKTKLGMIPEEWEIVELQIFADLIMGQSPSSESYNQAGDGLPFFQGNSDFVKNSKYPRIRQWTTSPTKISQPGSILFSVRAPVGDVFLNNIKACIGRGLASLNAKKGNSQEFLYYCLQNLNGDFNKLSQGSTFTAINSDSLKRIKIMKPTSIKEQEKIAGVLLNVDNKISINKQLKEKLIRLKRGLMQDLLSGNVVI
jgi:type I restriction enzyme S subunit